MKKLPWWPLVSVVIIGLLIAVHTRWLGQLHRAEAVRRAQWLQRTTFLLADEVNTELEELGNHMAGVPPDPRAIVEKWRQWQGQALDEQLVATLWLVSEPPGQKALRVGPQGKASRRSLPVSLKSWLYHGEGLGVPPVVVATQVGEKPPVVVLEIDEARFLQTTFHRAAARLSLDLESFHIRLISAATGQRLAGESSFNPDGSTHFFEPDFFSSPFAPELAEDFWSNSRALNGDRQFHFVSTGALRLETRLAEGNLAYLNQRDRLQKGVLAAAGWLLLMAAFVSMLAYLHQTKQLARQQAVMMATFSHELRTPLTALSMAGENLSGAAVLDADRVKVYGELIVKESSRLRTMVNQILQYATNVAEKRRVQSGALSNVAEAIESVKSEMAVLFREKQCALQLTLETTQLEVAIEPEALRTVVRNLFSNALKFGPPGRTIDVILQAARHRKQFGLSLRCVDHGYGIARGEGRKIFRRFFRGQLARESQIQGIGLGLSLVDKLVRQAGGQVSCQNHPEGGGLFIVWLPSPEALQ